MNSPRNFHPVQRAARLLGMPVRLIGHGLSRLVPHVKGKRILRHKAAHISIGTVIIFVGSGLASIHQPWIPHFMWDGIAYTIHGIGAAPIAEHVLQFLFAHGDDTELAEDIVEAAEKEVTNV